MEGSFSQVFSPRESELEYMRITLLSVNPSLLKYGNMKNLLIIIFCHFIYQNQEAIAILLVITLLL